MSDVCTWTEDEDGNWETGCDQIFVLIEGTPKQNGMNYCCYCGKRIVEERYNDDLGPPLFAPATGPNEV